MASRYTSVTEIPGQRASKEQLSMLRTRYEFAAKWCCGKEVLEVACGSGMGLGYLKRVAKRVVGGDLDENNLRFAAKHYENRVGIEVQKFNAHELPFPAETFDVVVLFEALYYLQSPNQFLSECQRILRPGGKVVVCSANKECDGFNPSPLSEKYFSVEELVAWFQEANFGAEVFGSFLTEKGTLKANVVSFLKGAAVRGGFIPKTMKGKEFLKRIFFGKLSALPHEISKGEADTVMPVPLLSGGKSNLYRVIYAVGTKNVVRPSSLSSSGLTRGSRA